MDTDSDTPTHGPIKRSAHGVPVYDALTVRTIHRFLASCYTYFELRLEAERRFWHGMLDRPDAQKRIGYLQHAMSALLECGYRATLAQKHLLEVSDIDIDTWVNECHTALNNSKPPVPSQQQPSTTNPSEGQKPHGRKSTNGAGGSGRTSSRQQSKRSSKGPKRR